MASERIRKALDLTSWEAAQDLVRGWEAQGRIQSARIEVSIDDGVRRFLEDAKARQLSEATLQKYVVVLEKQLIPFCLKKGFRYLKELNLHALREFRQTWKDGAISGLKKLERLRAFFGFCCQSGWTEDNPATLIRPPKVTQPPTLPFSQDEFKRIFSACDVYGANSGGLGKANAVRLKALTLLLRYSGLRIRDAVCLPKKKLEGNRLFLYTQKTGVPVFIPLPEFVTEALVSFGSSNQEYFFWSGNGKPKSAVSDWQRSFRKLFRIAGIQGHPHRFRDTFAVELLLVGVPLDQVSILLGHSSIKVTERHYAPWVKTRQEQLEDSVRKTWTPV